MEISLFRHGDCGAAGRYCGATDLHLSATGVNQVQASAGPLKQMVIARVFCSPMARCRQSWDILDVHAPGQLVEDLREIDFGRWEGMTFPEIAAADPELVEAWARGSDDFAFPEGERLGDFRARMVRLSQKLSAPRQNILVISHGGVIRHLLCHLLGLPWWHYLLFDVQPGCYSILSCYSQGAVLTGLNLGGR